VTPEEEDQARKYIANEEDVTTSTSLLRAALADRQRTANALGNLLAIIHRDGGHHQGAVGDEQAVKDAHERWGRLITLAESAGRLRVVAAAVQTSDGMIHVLPPPNRHHNIIHALGYAGIDLVGREEQGFLLSDGSFADRPQALVIARAAGQVLRETGAHIGLFSEDVW
jgi:hypothetical protein